MTAPQHRRDLLIVACAVSAGIHAALVRGHFREGIALGAGFVVATVALAACAVLLTRAPADARVLTGTAALLAGLIGSYVLAVTTGLPLLHPQPEPVDGLALGTKAVEALGLGLAFHLFRRGRSFWLVALPPSRERLS